MEYLIGIGKTSNIQSGSASGCTMMNNEVKKGWCDQVDCSSYGKWWCPFTGW
jgi:hypothetical protein